MKITFFSAKPYDIRFFEQANKSYRHDLHFQESRLTPESASLAAGSGAVCAFVNDQLDGPVLERLAAHGTRLIALRSAGYNHIDLTAAARLGLTVVHVPRYSPHAVAEHSVGLILALNRHLPRAHNRVREGNFSIAGLLGFDLWGKTVGIVGAGRIGLCTGKILQGFGCHVLASDPHPSPEARDSGFDFCTIDALLAGSDIVSLHCPLTPETRHVINCNSLSRMRRGVMLINTSRGALVETPSVIAALLIGQIGYFGLDVYEDEADLFYEDHSDVPLRDDVFARLLTLPNVLVTGHQAFFTREALTTIADTTLASVSAFAIGRDCAYALPPPRG